MKPQTLIMLHGWGGPHDHVSLQVVTVEGGCLRLRLSDAYGRETFGLDLSRDDTAIALSAYEAAGTGETVTMKRTLNGWRRY